RLLLHLLHQPGALDDIGKARVIFDVGGDGELAARLDALDQDRLQHGAGSIDRRRISRWPRTDDDDLGMDGSGHGADVTLCMRQASARAEKARRARAGAESVKSKSKVSGEPCKNCNPYRRIFPVT